MSMTTQNFNSRSKKTATDYGENPDEVAPRLPVLGKLRKGYVMRIGKDQLVKGPQTVSLNRKTARDYLHMFDNREEIQEAFDLPRDKKAPSYEEEVAVQAQITIERRKAVVERMKELGYSPNGDPLSETLASAGIPAVSVSTSAKGGIDTAQVRALLEETVAPLLEQIADLQAQIQTQAESANVGGVDLEQVKKVARQSARKVVEEIVAKEAQEAELAAATAPARKRT